MPGSIARHKLLVIAVTAAAAVIAVAYAIHQPKVFEAKASIALVQPPQASALGTPVGSSPEQYVDSQMLLLQSASVAQHAAALANAAVHGRSFTAADFSGPSSSLKVTSQSATDPNTSIVEISFAAGSPADAAAGANAVLTAYGSTRADEIRRTDAALVGAIDSAVARIDSELASLSGAASPLNSQLATSLVAERSSLLQQRASAVIDEQVGSSVTPSMVSAYQPASAVNHKVTRIAPVGAVIGFVVSAWLAYVLETRSRWKARAEGQWGSAGTVPPHRDRRQAETPVMADWHRDARDHQRSPGHASVPAHTSPNGDVGVPKAPS